MFGSSSHTPVLADWINNRRVQLNRPTSFKLRPQSATAQRRTTTIRMPCKKKPNDYVYIYIQTIMVLAM
uniref:Uncharacterized protein n=1 Tax=Arion vulgaris TaxID=1028688 RepID=A0A0B7AEN8_9EUPU